MPLALRPHFGALAGGLEHALALATLAYAAQPTGGSTPASPPPFDLRHPTSDFDLYARMVTLLQHAVRHAGYTIEDLRREGFDEPVLSALH